jgi:hypothetical protein
MPSSAPLDNLVRIGQLKSEPPNRDEFAGLLRSGQLRLEDAANQALSIESRFDLAYNAAHALSLAALRWHGYRSENRYQVFQCPGNGVRSCLLPIRRGSALPILAEPNRDRARGRGPRDAGFMIWPL